MSNGLDKLKMGSILSLKLNLTLKVKVICPQNNRNLNQGVLLLWTKFGDPSMNRWPVIVRTIKWLIHTHTQTQATTIPGGQNWPRAKMLMNFELKGRYFQLEILPEFHVVIHWHHMLLNMSCCFGQSVRSIESRWAVIPTIRAIYIFFNFFFHGGPP